MPDVEYEITAFALNGTELDSKTINLTSNNKIVSFGFYSTEVPIVPIPAFIEALAQWFIVIVVILIFAVIALVVWAILYEEKLKRERNKNLNGYIPSTSKLTKTPYY